MTKPLRFDFADLRLLVAIGDSGSLSLAASRLPLALSAASHRIKQLEARLELTLFERNAQGMVCTPAGRLAIEQARQVLAAADAMQTGLNALQAQRRTRLTLRANTVANSSSLPGLLAEFMQANPLIDILLEECPSRDVLAALRAGEADVGVIDGAYPTDLTTLPFRQDRLVLLAARSHPLAQLGHCSFVEAVEHAFVGLSGGRSIQGFIERMAGLAGKTINFRAHAPNFSAIAQLVAGGVGVALVPSPVAQRYAEALDLAMIVIDDTWVSREMRLCVRSGEETSGPVRQLLVFLSGLGEGSGPG
ncbi:LysR substrate-binding domain-containing protein [Parachitinimonas caeni]|uniref:LysR substrate-binding domain-containing protein n=1 Tax=Parachitinimonas caeni TaxID=3031301 RepID=A0ABT7DVX2_9NEIS|nr:LysR substrate-binding domain-containing protein [Parachitinimonas caeni]MDK2124196.1 LysR substrate-binding domain-containing protein [Parachitinimonas caeni]